jgi:glycosyltransferase involved in cell wall biosynthesis
LPGGRLVLADFRRAFRHLSGPRAVVIRPMIRDLGFLPTAWRVKRSGTPLIGWSHGYSHRRDFAPKRRLRDRAHLAIVRYLDAYICYTEEVRRTLARYVDPGGLFVAPNDPGTEDLIAVRKSLEAEGRSVVRRALGLGLERYVSFIGRLQERKRPRELLSAYAHLVDTHRADVGLLVIGDGPLRPELERMASGLGLEHVHFLGARYGEEAARYLFASEVMAIPGALGLAEPHAFALGVPVVSRYLGDDLVGHGPEAAYVRPGENGEFAPNGANSAALAEAILRVLENRASYSRAAADYAGSVLGLDGMIDGFVAAIEYATA